jgi:hypothetical protein
MIGAGLPGAAAAGSAEAELALELGQVLGQRVHSTCELGAVGVGQLLVAGEAAIRSLVAREDGVDGGEVGAHLVDEGLVARQQRVFLEPSLLAWKSQRSVRL